MFNIFTIQNDRLCVILETRSLWNVYHCDRLIRAAWFNFTPKTPPPPPHSHQLTLHVRDWFVAGILKPLWPPNSHNATRDQWRCIVEVICINGLYAVLLSSDSFRTGTICGDCVWLMCCSIVVLMEIILMWLIVNR